MSHQCVRTLSSFVFDPTKIHLLIPSTNVLARSSYCSNESNGEVSPLSNVKKHADLYSSLAIEQLTNHYICTSDSDFERPMQGTHHESHQVRHCPLWAATEPQLEQVIHEALFNNENQCIIFCPADGLGPERVRNPHV